MKGRIILDGLGRAKPADAGGGGVVIRVLLVDDHPVVLDGWRLHFRDACDIEVVGTAGTGSQAIELARLLAPDVVLLDFVLPDLAGERVIERIVRGGGPRVVVVTGHADLDVASAAIGAGARGFVLKTMGRDAVLSAVRTVAHGGSFVDADLPIKLVVEGRGEPSDQGRPRHDRLSTREMDVFREYTNGRKGRAAARRLGIEPTSVASYRQRILDKLGLDSTEDLVRYAVEHGMFRREG